MTAIMPAQFIPDACLPFLAQDRIADRIQRIATNDWPRAAVVSLSRSQSEVEQRSLVTKILEADDADPTQLAVDEPERFGLLTDEVAVRDPFAHFFGRPDGQLGVEGELFRGVEINKMIIVAAMWIDPGQLHTHAHRLVGALSPRFNEEVRELECAFKESSHEPRR